MSGIRGRLTLLGATVTGGPFDAIPDGAFGVCLEPEATKAWLAEVSLPVRDFGVPGPAALRAAVGAVLAQIQAEPSRPVHVGCRAGLGRTGLFLACLARAAGVEGDPVEYVRRHYHPHAAETPEQEAVARAFTPP